MSTQQNKSMLKRIFSELNKGNFNVIDELFAEDFILCGLTEGIMP